MDKKAKKERQNAFESLPRGIREKLTTEEQHLFLTAEVWPESLFEKLEEFLVKE